MPIGRSLGTLVTTYNPRRPGTLRAPAGSKAELPSHEPEHDGGVRPEKVNKRFSDRGTLHVGQAGPHSTTRYNISKSDLISFSHNNRTP